jgi:ketosteroid isomerase-like protein
MARSPQEIFKHHAEALTAGDLDEIVADYTDDAVTRVRDGIDTFVFTDDGIRAQTLRFTPEPVG